MAKAQTTTETETIAFPDFTKAPDFTKMQAEFGKWFGDYTKAFNGKTGVVDFDAIFSAQRKNFEVMTAANQAAFEGVKAVAQRQAEIARKAVEEFGKVAKEFAEPASPEEKMLKQAEIAKAGFEQVVSNVREITDLVQKSNAEVTGLIQGRVAAQIDEVKTAIAKVSKK